MPKESEEKYVITPKGDCYSGNAPYWFDSKHE